MATCEGCKWFRIYAPDYPGRLGRCLFPLPLWMQRKIASDNVVAASNTDCPAHQPREVQP